MILTSVDDRRDPTYVWPSSWRMGNHQLMLLFPLIRRLGSCQEVEWLKWECEERGLCFQWAPMGLGGLGEEGGASREWTGQGAERVVSVSGLSSSVLIDMTRSASAVWAALQELLWYLIELQSQLQHLTSVGSVYLNGFWCRIIYYNNLQWYVMGLFVILPIYIL